MQLHSQKSGLIKEATDCSSDGCFEESVAVNVKSPRSHPNLLQTLAL